MSLLQSLLRRKKNGLAGAETAVTLPIRPNSLSGSRTYLVTRAIQLPKWN
jgi:hypothetical protein